MEEIMKTNNAKKIMATVSIIAILGLATHVYADWGMGYGHQGWHHGGNNGYHMNGSGRWHMYEGNLPADDYSKLYKEHEAFLNETEEIRRELYSKGLELRDEMSKENPDKNKVFAVQKEISKLKGQLDRKSLDFELRTKEMHPNGRRMSHFRGNHMMGWDRGSTGRYQNCW